jgi:hypothetical protein
MTNPHWAAPCGAGSTETSCRGLELATLPAGRPAIRLLLGNHSSRGRRLSSSPSVTVTWAVTASSLHVQRMCQSTAQHFSLIICRDASALRCVSSRCSINASGARAQTSSISPNGFGLRPGTPGGAGDVSSRARRSCIQRMHTRTPPDAGNESSYRTAFHPKKARLFGAGEG